MNKSIVSAVVLVAAVSIVNAVLAKKPITKIVLGAYIFLLVLALTDALGGDEIASALAWLAVLVVVLDVLPWSVVLKLVSGNAPTQGGGVVS